jgi:acyl-CoA reductase-like NAD-dependent aldehyde dehydrogenase
MWERLQAELLKQAEKEAARRQREEAQEEARHQAAVAALTEQLQSTRECADRVLARQKNKTKKTLVVPLGIVCAICPVGRVPSIVGDGGWGGRCAAAPRVVVA